MFLKIARQQGINNKLFCLKNPIVYNFPKRFIASGANYQLETNKVKLRGRYLKSRNEDMPTLLWFPEVLEPVENWEKWFKNPQNKILDFRNVWLLNPRNFGESDHHKSFDLEEQSDDILRFIEENKLTYVTVGGHGYGAKIASAFGSYYFDRTSGVMCLEGGPMDHTFHEAWNEIRNFVTACSKLNLEKLSVSEIHRNIDVLTTNPKWRMILKQNIIEGKSTLQWKFNMQDMLTCMNKNFCDISAWSSRYGLYPGRAFVLFAEFSRWIFLNTNTIPFYKFFPKLEGRYPSNSFNFVLTPDNPLNHWVHEYPEDQTFTVMNRMARFLQFEDGVHTLLADRTEVGWYAIPERSNKVTGLYALGEYNPEHVHHNYKHTDAYIKSKERRGKKAASIGEFKQTFSNPELW